MTQQPARRRLLSHAATAATLAAALTLASPGTAHAQAAGDTMTMVIPYAPGGTADILGRRLAEVIRQSTGITVVIDNPAGAGGSIGTANVARAKPDGKTILIASTSALTIGPHLGKLPYDPLKDLTPIRSAGIGPVTIAATKSAKFTDLAGAFAQARKEPGSVRYATPGQGSLAHLALEGLQAQAGVSMTHVPYRGEAPAVQDALGGVIELLVVNTPTVLPHVQSGALKPLVVLEPKRLPVWPTVPTLAEAGYKNLEYASDFGVFAPAGLPADVKARLDKMFSDAVVHPSYLELLAQRHLLSGSAAGAAYGELIAKDFARNGEIIRDRKIEVR